MLYTLKLINSKYVRKLIYFRDYNNPLNFIVWERVDCYWLIFQVTMFFSNFIKLLKNLWWAYLPFNETGRFILVAMGRDSGPVFCTHQDISLSTSLVCFFHKCAQYVYVFAAKYLHIMQWPKQLLSCDKLQSAVTGINTGLSMSTACARRYRCRIRACRLDFA